MKLCIHALDKSKVFINHSLKKGIVLEKNDDRLYISLLGSDCKPIEVSKDEWDRINVLLINIIASENK